MANPTRPHFLPPPLLFLFLLPPFSQLASSSSPPFSSSSLTRSRLDSPSPSSQLEETAASLLRERERSNCVLEQAPKNEFLLLLVLTPPKLLRKFFPSLLRSKDPSPVGGRPRATQPQEERRMGRPKKFSGLVGANVGEGRGGESASYPSCLEMFVGEMFVGWRRRRSNKL